MNAYSLHRSLNYVTYRHLFMRALFPSVSHLSYVLLKRHFLPVSSLGNSKSLNILTAKSTVEDWINLCSFSPYVQRLDRQEKARKTYLGIQFSDGSSLTLHLVHSLSYLGLTWIDVESVLQQATINREGVKIADPHFYLEYTYLSAVLSRRPVDSEYVYYFCDRPAAFQTRLLRKFKQRYPVQATSLAELFACTYQHRRRVMTMLESLPHNKWSLRFRHLAQHSWKRFKGITWLQRATRFATGIR
ncbi:MAG: hypothetical protein AAFV07_16585 [Bacteroidota bacterium]